VKTIRARKILFVVVASASAASCGPGATPAPQPSRPLFDPTLLAIERVTRPAKPTGAPAFTADRALADLGYDEPLVAPNGSPACGNVGAKGSRGNCRDRDAD
jgi:hypothetical protein